MKVLKAVLPVAGLGTRMLPATKAIPKEMLPLVDKPLIQYVVNEAVAAGIKEIVLVTHASKNSIENHFDTSFELEATLEARVKRSLLEEVRSIVPKDVTVISVRQSAPLGLGHAVLAARPIVGNNPFAVMLPDVIIDKYKSNPKTDNLSQMIERFDKTGHNQVMVEPVPQEQVHQYGVVDLAGKKINAGENAAITNMVEKPNNDEAPSNLAITGRYVVSPTIWDLLEYTPPGAGGEIQLTDALLQLRHLETLEAYHLKGKSHDCGSKLGYMLANVEYAMQSSQMGEEFKSRVVKMLS
ncbi:UTP--glucose-1-phosphate uridylyltransferase GalU [Pseudoalteromonas sp. CST5]|uniref:UTP--glucose-1-phosphate uridylyltransferase GalU n=1 Tax=unclassified Pseudoalteromonas TaxID=194690 RepID=UPI00235893FD|nr:MULTISPECIES: UTP--glucose-1-phosphate uridylyltransferase GalU [unclassified Pseudoalteromonas]MDC9514541.1 UTP--glucose-1-phosphate uridylyltransferase GalU [Pseudoalteromonas sp. CST1]MDC9539014.1 UTP--glucose-1-phosphate uridylyltransferase GalU [Pseudoalteromonas sp. CST3]MDC9541806.1 UTP--glucose-1-phosphate uridylyltransferase GalU [Pseudoalteromonas sp. CST2]MDC9547244.1 UTP--glucose-1-phosphate uridylyltransferase GalU [Pseudoalteromonas sp. CST4]MDC9550713.1 UTP--glucose-1-phospha